MNIMSSENENVNDINSAVQTKESELGEAKYGLMIAESIVGKSPMSQVPMSLLLSAAKIVARHLHRDKS
jgi:hypothetical protein